MTRPYTPETLAAEWQCSAKHIRDLIHCGKLLAFDLGKGGRKKLLSYPGRGGGGVQAMPGYSPTYLRSAAAVLEYDDIAEANRRRG